MTIDSRPDVTVKMCSAAASAKWTYRCSERSDTGTAACRASTEVISATAGWNRGTSAYTSTRLQVERSSTSLMASLLYSSSSVLRMSSPGTAARSSTDTGAVRCESPTTTTLIG